MRWLIVGAGGIGLVYGTRLVAIGESVTFVARGAHLEAMRAHGAAVAHPTFAFEGPVDAVDVATLRSDRDPGAFDAVLVALKAYQVRDVLGEVGPWLARGDAPVVSLQNGVDAEAWIADGVGGARTLGGVAAGVGAHVVAPGRVEAQGEARLVLGPWPDGRRGEADPYEAQALADAFERAGVPATSTQRIEAELWRKWMTTVALNPLSAWVDRDPRALIEAPEYAPVVEAIVREVHALGLASGVPLDAGDVDATLASIRALEAVPTSMQVDRARGRPLEVAATSGAVRARAAERGVPVPTTAWVDAGLRGEADVVVG